MRFDTKTLEFDKILARIKPYAQSVPGKERVEKLSPSSSVKTVNTMLDETLEGIQYIDHNLMPSFSDVTEIREALKRAKIQGVLSIDAFLDIFKHIRATKRIKREMMRLSDVIETPVMLEKTATELIVCQELFDQITGIMNEDGEVLSTASSELKTIRKQMDITERRIKSTLDQILKKESKRLSELLITERYGRQVIPVKISEKNNIKGTILDYSNSGETAYIEPESIRELTSVKMRLQADEKKEIERLLYLLTLSVQEDYEPLKTNVDILGHLDFVFAKAQYAFAIEAVKPEIKDTINLIKARHPLIPSGEIVANTITFDEGVHAMVITGSNTGGKTVTLKTMGLLNIMVQSGCLIPVLPGSSTRCFKHIVADIGDEQSIEQSLSTFSSHMNNIVSILNNLEPNSMVLLDELGSGTDPKEGASLAMSILEYLLNQTEVFVMATTHYPELKAYAYTKPSIVNASVEFDEETLQPTYRLLLRTPGESHAFLIGRRLGLSEAIIDDAKQRNLTSKTEVTTLIDNLKHENIKLDKIVQEQETLLKTLKKDKQSSDAMKKQLREEKDTFKEKLTLENQKVIADLKREAMAIIKTLESMQNQSFKAHELADIKHRLKSMNQAETKASSTKDHRYEPGDQVYLIKFNRYGELLKKQKNNQWLVKMGRLNSVFKEDEFEYVEDAKQPLEKDPTPKQVSPTKKVTGELDLRGLRVHEAEALLQKYLDDCLVAKLPYASIIHGFGTLALRKMVRDVVKTHPLIQSHRDGEGNEGGQGVTIVYFK